MLSPELRIKDHADHAGPFHPLVPSKEPTRSKPDPSFHFQNNNSLTAPNHTEMPDAMVDLWTMPSNTPKQTKSNLNQTTHTKVSVEAVAMLPPEDKSNSLD